MSLVFLANKLSLSSSLGLSHLKNKRSKLKHNNLVMNKPINVRLHLLKCVCAYICIDLI